jgi:hypothetical protein
MSSPDTLANDFIVWCLVVPISLTIVAFGFCIVYRRWFDIPVVGIDHSIHIQDPGRAGREYVKQSSRQGNSIYSLKESHPQSSNKRMRSWDV